MLRLSFAACALLGMAVRVNAQDTTGIRPGARMRVATSLQVEGRQENFTIVGTLTAFDANRLMIRRTDAAQLDTVPFSLVRHAEVSRGPRPARSSAIRGSIIGGVIGAAAAAAIIAFRNQTDDQEDHINGPIDGTIGSLARLSIPFGAVIGGLFGASRRGDQWLRVSIPAALEMPR